jgi:antirestriction protein ArdC
MSTPTGPATPIGSGVICPAGSVTRAYGAEELVAELGAAFWCAQFGIDQATRTDHAAYLADWLAILAADSRALVAACGLAQRAVDYLNTAAGWIALTIPTLSAVPAAV